MSANATEEQAKMQNAMVLIRSSLDVLRDIRLRYPTKPVVLITTYREEMTASIEKGLQIGAYTCLYNPLATEELIGIIKEIRQNKLQSFLDEPTGIRA